MKIKFYSSVIIVKDLIAMRLFYETVLQQKVILDYGNCIAFENGLSLWRLTPEYPIAQKRGNVFNENGNTNFELCFESDDFEDVITHLEQYTINYLHNSLEERWGQQTVRFYDPEQNLIEIGETLHCFVTRFYKQGLNFTEIVERTSVPLEKVTEICS